MAFMSSLDIAGKTCLTSDLWMHVSRSGYTGEDGYELAIKRKRCRQNSGMMLEELIPM